MIQGMGWVGADTRDGWGLIQGMGWVGWVGVDTTDGGAGGR